MTESIKAIIEGDVVNYTGMMADDGLATARAVEHLIDDIVTPAIERYSGRLFKRNGDNFFGVFPTNKTAALAAIAIQRTLAAARAGGTSTLEVRIGVDSGDVDEREDRDLTGLSLIRAVRAEGAAEANTTMVTDGVRQSLDRATGIIWRDMGDHGVKHGGSIRLYRIDASDALPSLSRAPRADVRRPEKRGFASRVGFGINANALTYSNIGLHLMPTADARTVDTFDAVDDALIQEFVRTLPGCENYAAYEAGDDVVLADAPIKSVADFDGRVQNGIEVQVDGTLTIRFALTGAHFLYDVMRTLCCGFALANFLRTTFRTESEYHGRFGYAVRGEQTLYPDTISEAQFECPVDFSSGDLAESALSSTLLRWSRAAWNVKFSAPETTAMLRKFAMEHFAQTALRVSEPKMERPCFRISATLLDVDQARRRGSQSSMYQIEVAIEHVSGSADFATLVVGGTTIPIGPIGGNLTRLVPLPWTYGQPTTNVPRLMIFEYGNAEWINGLSVVALDGESSPPTWSYDAERSRLPTA